MENGTELSLCVVYKPACLSLHKPPTFTHTHTHTHTHTCVRKVGVKTSRRWISSYTVDIGEYQLTLATIGPYLVLSMLLLLPKCDKALQLSLPLIPLLVQPISLASLHYFTPHYETRGIMMHSDGAVC